MPDVPAIQPIANPLTGLIRLQELQGLAQDRALKAQQLQQAQAAQQRASQALSQFAVDPDTGMYNVPEITKSLFQTGLAPEHVEILTKGFDGFNNIARQAQQDKITHLSKAAGLLMDLHGPQDPVTADTIHSGVAALKRIAPFLVTDQDEQAITAAIGGGADPRHVLESIKKLGEKPETFASSPLGPFSTSTGRSPTGQALTPQPKTDAEQEFDAATVGTPQETPTAKTSAAAVKARNEKATTTESKTMLIDGQPRIVLFNPKAKTYTLPGTGEDVSAVVQPFERAETEAGRQKQQEQLEQEYRGVLMSELRSRSGGMGLQDMKVNQANDLMGVLDQFRGKNMPAAVQGELALGVARLLSPSGSVGVEMMNEFNQRTAQQGLSKAVAWLTGDPEFVNATPDAMRNMFEEMITRQGQISEQQRAGYFEAIRSMAPTDLEPKRKTTLEAGMGLNPFVGSKKGSSSGTTHMQAPDGRDMPAVPNSEVERLKALGAKVIQ